jgi:hypothetical protein
MREGVTLNEQFIRETSDEVPDMTPRLLPFAVGTDNEYEIVCQIAASVSVFIENDTLGVVAFGRPDIGGLFIPMQPNHLRSFGNSILAMADQLDGGRGKQ